MSEYDKELQSNTDEYDKAIEPLERETKKNEERAEEKRERTGDEELSK